MRKIVIAGSSKLYEQIAYWRGYFEGRGYEVLDYPQPTPEENYAVELTKTYQNYYRHLDETDAFFLMNEDRGGVTGYIGPSAISELTYTVISNLNHDKHIDISILKMPSLKQNCYAEVKFWVDQGWVKVFEKPSRAALVAPEIPPLSLSTETNTAKPERSLFQRFLTNPDEAPTKTLDITLCRKKCLNSLTVEAREYLRVLSPEFPAWLLKYIAVPEFQRLAGVSMTTMDYSSIYNFPDFNSVLSHSIGVALIVWRFTRDKRQTIAALYHDISSPAFKHTIDYMNGDALHQESLERDTADLIRSSRGIMRLLKRDGILASEITDYKLYPLADNEAPRLAADRLEYTFSNGLFCYETWDLEQVRRFYENITILENEDGLFELGFTDQKICEDFVRLSMPLFEAYVSNNARASLQFLADVIRTMINKRYLSMKDLFIMNEREVIEWILSCGDKSISEAFRQFQRATSAYGAATAKKKTYATDVICKRRYINPLISGGSNEDTAKRIDAVSDKSARLINKFIDAKTAKFVGFDFEFKPQLDK